MSDDDDLDEFGASDHDSDEAIGIDTGLKAEFKSACQYLSSNAGHFQENDLVFFYAHYKQALSGECCLPKPGMFDFAGKKKWVAWKALGTLPQSNAMQSYVKRLREIDVNWRYDETSGKQKSAAAYRPSLPVREDDVENESDPFSLVSNGQIDKLRLLSSQLTSSESNFDYTTIRNDEGLTLLHLACDRGYQDIALFLINDLKIKLEATDESGQTALHYAAFCGHLECVELLMKCGANPDCVDSDGQKPLDVCEDDEIRRALQHKGNVHVQAAANE